MLLLLPQLIIVGQSSCSSDSLEKISFNIDTGDDLFYQRLFDSASYHYKAALTEIYRINIKDTLQQLKCLIRLANTYMSDGSIDSVDRYLLQAEDLIDNTKHIPSGLFAEVNFIKGHLYYVYNEIDSAEIYLAKSSAYCDKMGNDSLGVLILKDYGNIELSKNSYNSALQYYELALKKEKSRASPSDLILSSLYQNMSIAYARRFEYSEAKDFFKTSLDIKEKLLANDDILLIHAYINYSLLLTETGDFNEALEFSNLAENLLLSKYDSDHYLLGHVYHDKSIILEKIGRSNEAIIYFDKAIGHISNFYSNNKKWLGQIYSNLGVSYFSLGEIDEALKYYKISLQHDPDVFTKIINLSMIANCYVIKRNNNLALKYFEFCIDNILTHGLDNTLIAANLYSSYGIFIARLGDMSASMKYLQKSAEFIKTYSIYDPSIYSHSLNNLAEYYLFE